MNVTLAAITVGPFALMGVMIWLAHKGTDAMWRAMRTAAWVTFVASIVYTAVSGHWVV